MEPAVADRLVGSLPVAVVTVEHDVAADDDFADRAPIVGDLFTGLGLHYPELAGGDHLATLASFDDSPFGGGERFVFRSGPATRVRGRGFRPPPARADR